MIATSWASWVAVFDRGEGAKAETGAREPRGALRASLHDTYIFIYICTCRRAAAGPTVVVIVVVVVVVAKWFQPSSRCTDCVWAERCTVARDTSLVAASGAAAYRRRFY